MSTVTATEAHAEFRDILHRATHGKERFLITQDGRVVAAMIPIEDLELLEELEDRIDLEDARAALAEAKAGGVVTLEEFKASLGP
jgi:prevent-host-death family protein